LARLGPRAGASASTGGTGSHAARATWARLRRYDVGFRISICRPARPAAARAGERPWRMELADECELLQHHARSEHELLAIALTDVLTVADTSNWFPAERRG